MSFRDRLFERLSPELLSGITLRRWLALLAENRFAVDPSYWPRAAVTTLFSLRNSCAGWIEHLRYSRQIAATEVRAPVFVLGIFRSGTTHLHNLLAVDPQFAFPTRYEVSFPHTFLTLEKLDTTLLGWLLPGHRPQDNVAMSFQQPHEDEVALCGTIARTFLLDMVFPRRAEFYRRYYTLDEVTDQERQQWLETLRWFLQKVTLRHGRTLIMKSPGHTCRVKLLLDMFPDARFIHIRRHPHDVYRSWHHMARSVSQRWTLQKSDHSTLSEDIILHYRLVYDAWFRDRDAIPDGRLCELSYENLVDSPVTCLRSIYDKLSMTGFEEFLPHLEHYLRDQAAYLPNSYAPLPDDLRTRLATEWSRCFAEWGYEP